MQDASLFYTIRKIHRQFIRQSKFELLMSVHLMGLIGLAIASCFVFEPFLTGHVFYGAVICFLSAFIWIGWRLMHMNRMHQWLTNSWLDDSRRMYALILQVKATTKGPESNAMHQLSLAWQSLQRHARIYQTHRDHMSAYACMNAWRDVGFALLALHSERNEQMFHDGIYEQVYRLIGLSRRVVFSD